MGCGSTPSLGRIGFGWGIELICRLSWAILLLLSLAIAAQAQSESGSAAMSPGQKLRSAIMKPAIPAQC
jgi:hypothetical protein